jgi:hypothetical protein
MSKQTAVNWLIEQISSSKYFYNLMEEIQSKSTIAEPNGILHKAKEMEKEQIINSFDEGKSDGYKTAREWDEMIVWLSAEQYYNETYGTDKKAKKPQ